ncbi:protein-tyrosine phosphatase-like protein [Trichophaea hybrida]|nr:protein-tyrosine phosphatase-like protein [Trichophaea hybrida]
MGQSQEPGHPSYAQCDEITPCLYLGNLVAANSTDYLVRKGITHVLTLTSERVTVPTWAGIVHKQFRVRDTRRQNLLQYLLDGVQFVEDAFLGIIPAIAVGDKDWPPSVPTLQPEREVRVFVHCRAGISRSGSVVVAYVMKNYCLDFTAALSLVREKRQIVNPNHAFVSQLYLLHSTNFDLSHLGPEVLNQPIDNPYDPDERQQPWERHPELWRCFLECSQSLLKLGLVSTPPAAVDSIGAALSEDAPTEDPADAQDVTMN